MSFDFSNISRQEIKTQDTAQFTFYRIQGMTPVLTVKPATEANPDYMRAILRGSREQMRRMRGADLTPEMLKENREKDRQLFPRFVVMGWEGVLDASGEPVTFSQDACEAFLRALPDDIFNELRDFCSTPDNFRDTVGEEDVEAIAGN